MKPSRLRDNLGYTTRLNIANIVLICECVSVLVCECESVLVCECESVVM